MSTVPSVEAWRGVFTFSLHDLTDLADDKAVPRDLAQFFWAPLSLAFVTTNIRDARTIALWMFNIIDFLIMNYRPFSFNDELNNEFLSRAIRIINLEQMKLFSVLVSYRAKNGWLLNMIQRFVIHEKSKSFIDRLFGRR